VDLSELGLLMTLTRKQIPTCTKDRPKKQWDADPQSGAEHSGHEGDVRTGSEEYGG
jgi:hypothetical protein